MTEVSLAAGARLRLARQARGLSQQQLAGMAGVTRQALSAVESGHSDPSLRVALALARGLGVTVEELFGRGDPADPVLARPVAPIGGSGSRVALAAVGDTFVALPLRAETAARAGFGPAGGLVADPAVGIVAGPRGSAGQPAPGAPGAEGLISVRPIGPPRPTLLVAGCDPALPLLETSARPARPAGRVRLVAVRQRRGAAPGRRGACARRGRAPPLRRDRRETVADRGAGSWPASRAARPDVAGRDGGVQLLAGGAGGAPRHPDLRTRRCGQAQAAPGQPRARFAGADPARPRAAPARPGPGRAAGYDSRATGHLQVASAIAPARRCRRVERARRTRLRAELHPARTGTFRPRAAGQARRVPGGPRPAQGALLAVAAGPARQPPRLRARGLVNRGGLSGRRPESRSHGQARGTSG